MEAVAHRRFAEVVEPHLPALRRFVERRDPELGDDVMQEVGVVAWRRLDEMPSGHERAWLFGVARMVLLAERRRVNERRARQTQDDTALHALPSPGGLSPLLAPPVAEALARVSDRDRELLLLTAWEGLSTGEAAEALGIRATAARMGLVRARRRLAAALDDLDPGWDDGRGRVAASPISPDHSTAEEAPSCRAARS